MLRTFYLQKSARFERSEISHFFDSTGAHYSSSLKCFILKLDQRLENAVFERSEVAAFSSAAVFEAKILSFSLNSIGNREKCEGGGKFEGFFTLFAIFREKRSFSPGQPENTL